VAAIQPTHSIRVARLRRPWPCDPSAARGLVIARRRSELRSAMAPSEDTDRRVARSSRSACRSDCAAPKVGDLHRNRGYDSLCVIRKGGRRDALAIKPAELWQRCALMTGEPLVLASRRSQSAGLGTSRPRDTVREPPKGGDPGLATTRNRENVDLKTVSLSTLRLLAALAMLSSAAVHAEDRADPCAALFDHPVAVQRVPPGASADPIGEITCTYYAALMVRETGADSPSPGAATIVPVADASPRPLCNAAHAAREVSLQTANYALVGRKGPFLFFGAADPQGAVEFLILTATTGQVIHNDGMYAGYTSDNGKVIDCTLQSVALEEGALHIRFTRAFNGSCSIAKDGAKCWARMAREGKIPHSLAQAPPPVHACAVAYRKQQLPADDPDPSEIYYDVDLTVDPSGRTQVNARGAVGCLPVP
jgi:hypothetical protein